MKKLYPRIICILLLSTLGVYSQKIKYKEVYSLVKIKNYDAAYPLLKSVLKIDTSIASANLHIGNIFYQKAKAYDVLKENDAAIKFCDSAFFYLSRAKRLINEKEIKKNDEYYTMYAYNTKDTTKPISNRDTIFKRITNDIIFKTKDVIIHKNAIGHISSLFNKSVNNYAKAGTAYRIINSKYITVKELCLLSDESIEKELKNIVISYDSSIYYLDAYKKAIKEYPIKNYNQHYEIETIETYRLDGLSKTDFLGSKLLLWNYGKWTKEVSAMIEKDIKTIRSKILTYDALYNNIFERIENRSIGFDSATAIKPDQKFYMLSNKYDYNSLAFSILNYKQKKLDFYGNTLSKYNSLENTNASNFETKSAFMFDLTGKIAVSDTFLQKLKTINLSKETHKYTEFVTKKFVDAKGITSFIEKETQFIKQNKVEYNLRYTSLMFNHLMKYADTTVYFMNNNTRIPFFTSFKNGKSNIKTTSIKEDKKGNIFICGYVIPTSGTTNAFVCKLNEIRQVAWFKSIPIKPENKAATMEFASEVEPFDEGCIVAINSKQASGIKNHLIRFDKNGIETVNRKFENGGVIRQFEYDEINDNFILVSKGENPQDFTEKEEPLNIICYDNAGNSKWVHKFNLLGSVSSFNKIFEGYLLSCNFVSLNTGANSLTSKAGTTIDKPNIFLLKINTSGQIIKYETIDSFTPVYAIGTVRINNNNINILGYKTGLTPNWMYNKFEDSNNKFQQVTNSNIDLH